MYRDKYKSGDFVSFNKFTVKTPGRLSSGYGQEVPNIRFHGVRIYNYATYGVIWIENQVSLGSGETVMINIKFEEWLWNQAEVEVKLSIGDNVIFTVDMFKNDCDKKDKSKSFSGVGEYHQNNKAERDIQTIMNIAREFMVHASLHWKYRGFDDL